MLGRTAASLFWMSRYVERAENMARLLEVGYRISLMPGAIEGHRDEWRSTLTSAACEASYFDKHEEIATQRKSSIICCSTRAILRACKSCLKTARNNGRAVRTALTRDVWESLNGTWNELAQVKPQIDHRRPAAGLPRLDQAARHAVSRRAARHHAARTTLTIFSQLGTFIERADNTARILDVKYYILLPQPSDVGSELDMQQWATVLRSVSAHRAYRWFYHDSRYRPWLVAEFLILREEMPRSLIFCYQWINPRAGRPGRALWQAL